MLKYPLTDFSKQIAQDLVAAWDNGAIEQFFHVHDATTMGSDGIELIGGIGIIGAVAIPPIENLLELSVYGLIQVTPIMSTYERGGLLGTSQRTDKWEVLLLQELKNAVSNDFAVSEYFLTVNAVGTIINTSGGDLTIAAPFQSAASPYGTVYQAQQVKNLSYEVREILGPELLHNHPELRQSLESVEHSSQANRMTNLGNLLSHLANLVTIGEAIPAVSRAIELVGKAISHVS